MHDHAHSHRHHHHASARPRAGAVPYSLLRMSVGERLVYVAVVVAAIWGGVFWAVS